MPGISTLAGKSSRTVSVRIVSAAVASAAVLATGACFSSDDPEAESETVPALLAYDHPCELLDVSDASDMLFGTDSAAVDWSEETTGEFSECRGHLLLTEGDEEVGSIDFLGRVFDLDNLEPEGSHGGIGRFQLGGQTASDEILDWSVDTMRSDWDGGETYVLDGMGLSRDVTIVGSWGKGEDFAVGVSFRIAAKSDFYDEHLVYHQYCDTTDLESGCLISADVLYQWMDTEYLSALFDSLTEAASS